MSVYDVSSTALLQAIGLGFDEDVEDLVVTLSAFAHRSAKVTHPRGNRRYGGYVLDVEDERIYGIYKFDERASVCTDCHGTRRHRMRDGRRWVEVPCQTCTEGVH